MSEQNFLQLPRDQQWEYAILISNRTAGFFGTIGAKQSLIWSSTLEDEGEISFEGAQGEVLYQAGKAGWELVSSTSMTTVRGGNSNEVLLTFIFKQRPATTEEVSLAQIIDPSALLRRANRYMQQSDLSHAMAALNRALALKPQHPELHYLSRSRVHLAAGDEQQALDDLNRALEANKQSGEAWKEAGDIHYRRKEYEAAIDHYSEALRCMRDDYQSSNAGLISVMRYTRGLAYRATGKPKEAIKDLKDYLNRAQVDGARRAEVEDWIKEMERRR